MTVQLQLLKQENCSKIDFSNNTATNEGSDPGLQAQGNYLYQQYVLDCTFCLKSALLCQYAEIEELL